MVINRYISKEILFTLLAVLVVLLLIFISNRYVRFLADASTGSLSDQVVLLLLSLKTVSALTIIVPLGLFLSILVALGRLYKDSEMVVMMACGVSIRRVYGIVLGVAFVVAIVVGQISLYSAPWAEELSYRILDKEKASVEFNGIAAGRFTEPGNSDSVFYAEKLSTDGASMQNVFIQGQREGRLVIVSSENAHRYEDKVTGSRFVVLENGYRYEGLPGSPDFRITQFEKYTTRVDEPEIVETYRKHRAKTTAALWASGEASDLAEIQWRVSMPLSVVLLAILAVPLSYTTPRQGRFSKLFIAILIYVIYSNMMGVAISWVESNDIPVALGVWWVHAILIVITFVMLARQYGTAWMFRALFRRTSR